MVFITTMMTLANYGIGSSKTKDSNSAKVLSKSLQIRNRAELMLKQHLKSYFRVTTEKRNEIFSLINDYYSRIPFNVLIWNKYQTKQCIVDSILIKNTKFNPYKARQAFRLVEQMLINLVYLPWHKEFRKIYTYSGQYRLQISEPTIDIEEVLKAAGFEQTPECKMVFFLPDNRMPQVDDGESVTSVIFDCMVAQVVLTNIIEIFDNCCKQAKQCQESMTDINYYSWIQAYFRERSQQTTERACTNIQELLNNITNHLSKTDLTSLMIPPDRSQSTTALKSQNYATTSAEKVRGSPKLSTQERTREFLSQQTRDEEDELITLPNDLLRLPSGNTTANTINTSDFAKRPVNRGKSIDHGGLISHRSDLCRSPPSDIITHQQHSVRQLPQLNNGYNTNQFHQQALFDRESSTKSSQSPMIEFCDYIDSYHNNGSINHNHRTSNDSLSLQSNDLDLPHDDREQLIPRLNDLRISRALTHHHQDSHLVPSIKRNSFYDNDFETVANLNHHHSVKLNGPITHSTNQRHKFEEINYSNDPTSHLNHQQPITHQTSRGSAMLKYNSSCRKYESRDMEDRLANSRSYWSCSSCTYNNQISSEICEMCRNRRPSH